MKIYELEPTTLPHQVSFKITLYGKGRKNSVCRVTYYSGISLGIHHHREPFNGEI
jgi:hypothetical protein